jgi:tape measure domain-containing protein
VAKEILARIVIKDDGSLTLDRVRKGAGDVGDALRHAGTDGEKAGGRIRSGTSNAGGGVEDLYRKMTRLIGAVGGIYGIYRGFEAILSTTAKFETLRTVMNGVTGSIEGGAKAVDWVKGFARSTPFEIEGVTNAFIRLKGQGLDPTDGTLQVLGDAVAMFADGSKASLDRVITAVGQIAAKGKLSSEELKQLAEANIPVYKILKEELGMTGAEVQDIGSKGISAGEGLNALFRGLDKMTGGAMQDQMGTLNGLWSNFKDSITVALAEIGGGAASDAAKKSLNELIAAIGRMSETGDIKRIGEIFGQVMTAIATAVTFVALELPLRFKLAIESTRAMFLEFFAWYMGVYTDVLSKLRTLAATVTIIPGSVGAAGQVFLDLTDTINGLSTSIRDGAIDELAAVNREIGGVEAALNTLKTPAAEATGAVKGAGDAAQTAGDKFGGLKTLVGDAGAGVLLTKTSFTDLKGALNDAVTKGLDPAQESMSLLGAELDKVIEYESSLGPSLDTITDGVQLLGDEAGISYEAFNDLNITANTLAGTLVTMGFNVESAKDAVGDLGVKSGSAHINLGMVKDVAEKLGIALDGPGGLIAALHKAGNGGVTFGDILDKKVNKQLFDAEAYAGSLKTAVAGLFDDAFLAILEGDISDLGDIVGGFFTNMGKNLATALSSAITDSLSGDGTLGENLGKIFSKENAVGNIIGGAGMLYSATQASSRTEGVMSGLMGGASMGAAIGSIIPGVGTVVGAIVGGVIGGIAGYFSSGGSDPARVSFAWGEQSGFQVYDSGGHLGFSDDKRRMWEKKVNSMYEKEETAYLTLLEQFNSADLFGMIKDNASRVFDFGSMEMDPKDLAEWLAEVWIPGRLDDRFGEAIKMGLANLGVSDAMVTALFDEMSSLSGTDRLALMSNYISLVTGLNDLSENLHDIDGQASVTQWELFAEAFQDVLKTTDTYLASFEQMDLSQQIDQGGKILGTLTAWYDSAVQYLQALKQLTDQMQQSIDSARERVAMRGMNPTEQGDYAGTRLQDLIGQLEYASDPAQAQYLFQEAMRYFSVLEGLKNENGDYLYSDMLLNGLLTNLETAMQTAMGGFTSDVEGKADEIAAIVDQVLASLLGDGSDAEQSAKSLSDLGDSAEETGTALDDVGLKAADLGGSFGNLSDSVGVVTSRLWDLAGAAGAVLATQGGSPAAPAVSTSSMAEIAAAVASRVYREATA